MLTRSRLAVSVLVVAVVAVVAALLLGGQLVGAVATVDWLRAALGVCAVCFLVVTVVYGVDGYTEQATGHAVAGAGFAVVALGVEGPVAWLGVGLIGGGGALLLHDAVERGGRGRTLV